MMTRPDWIPALLLCLLVGCGGSDNTAPAPEKPEITADPTTQDLVADRHFDFRVDAPVTVHLNRAGNQPGSYQLYSAVAYRDDVEGLVAPDPQSRIATLPGSAPSLHIAINKTWQHLVVEWHPQSGLEPQQTRLLTLVGETDYVVQFD
ncbi:hypothetical protein KUV89_08495 [Marinobacter hydrocarbonoclasticus]|nr:hypothetical protein [Marinobacter nauticus]